MSKIEITKLENSIYNSNSFILSHAVGQNVEVWIVDMGDAERIESIVPSTGLIKGVIFTHTHFDHMYGINRFLELHPEIRIITNAFGKQALVSPKLNFSRYHEESDDIICSRPENIDVIEDGSELTLFGNVIMKSFATPGHDKSCMTYVVDDFVFCGDSYIPGVPTRATLPNSERSLVKNSENLIKKLACHKTLCPGHGSIYKEYNNE